MVPTPFQVQAGRISRVRSRPNPTGKARSQRIRSHKLNLDKIKEEALIELFTRASFSISTRIDQDEAADIALPDSDDDDIADQMQDLSIDGPGLGTYAYEDTAAAVMEIEWSEDIEESDDESDQEDDSDENDGDSESSEGDEMASDVDEELGVAADTETENITKE